MNVLSTLGHNVIAHAKYQPQTSHKLKNIKAYALSLQLLLD